MFDPHSANGPSFALRLAWASGAEGLAAPQTEPSGAKLLREREKTGEDMALASAIISARGGSKRRPDRSLKSFCGGDRAVFDQIVVSTDDAEIAAMAAAGGGSCATRWSV